MFPVSSICCFIISQESESIMSVSSQFNSVESLKTIAKKDAPESKRLCRIICKDVKGADGKVVQTRESKGVFIPVLGAAAVNVIAADAIGNEFLLNAILGAQDALVRKLVEAGKLTINDEEIAVSKILEAMAVSNESVRFSKESIRTWFADSLQAALTSQIKAKMVGISDSKLNQLLGNYLTSFQSLAGRNVSMSNAIKLGLIRALEFLPEDHDSATAQEIAKRLSEVGEATEMLAAL